MLFALPDELLERICFYLEDADVRRLKRCCTILNERLQCVYKANKGTLVLNDFKKLNVYLDLLSSYRWQRIDDQLGVLFEINGR